MKFTINIIIAICIYIPCFIFFYFKFKEKYSKLKTIFITAVLSYFITGLLTTLFIISMSYSKSFLPFQSKFDSIEFKKKPNERLSMKNDIVNNKILLNKTKSQIKKILGQPSETIDGKWHFSLGYTGVLSPTFYILELSFNNEKCNKINIKEIHDN